MSFESGLYGLPVQDKSILPENSSVFSLTPWTRTPMHAKAMFSIWPTASIRSDTGISQGLPAETLVAMLLKLFAMYTLDSPTANRRM